MRTLSQNRITGESNTNQRYEKPLKTYFTDKVIS